MNLFYYSYKTINGVIKIAPLNGRYCVIYNEENLGSYISAEAAADDISGGHTFMPSNGVDLGSLNIPGNINEWDKFPMHVGYQSLGNKLYF